MPLSTPPTSGDDIITMTGADATVDLPAGNDTFTVDLCDNAIGNVIIGTGANELPPDCGTIGDLYLAMSFSRTDAVAINTGSVGTSTSSTGIDLVTVNAPATLTRLARPSPSVTFHRAQGKQLIHLCHMNQKATCCPNCKVTQSKLLDFHEELGGIVCPR